MRYRRGFTLIEIIVVLIIIGVIVGFALPNFNVPIEQARVSNAQNNLLAIHSAQQNYNNNHNTYCLSANGVCTSLASINTTLSLNIQDDGTYTYICAAGPPPTCTATRTSTGVAMVLTLNAPVVLTGANKNPQ